VQSKYLSSRINALPPSGIRKFFDLASTMDNVISLSIGEPDFTTPLPVLEAGIQSLRSGETHYTANPGKIQLRKALSAHLQNLYHVDYDPAKEIMFTVGASEALHLAAVSLLNPGDEMIISTPCFVSYQGIISLAGGVPVEVACRKEDNFDLDPKAVEAAITPRTKAILINFPCNPTGAVASKETLLEIARLAEKHDLIVISDEIYDRLVYVGEHVCFAALPGMRERTLLMGGFSKDYAMTGWRIGFVAGPAEIVQALLRMHQYIVMCVSTTAQDAALEALKSGESFVKHMCQDYDRRRKLITTGLNQIGLPTVEPRGAFYAFPDITGTGLNSADFAESLLKEERVAVVPGSAFGLGGEGFVRCCYATAYDQIEEALERIERFVRKL